MISFLMLLALQAFAAQDLPPAGADLTQDEWKKIQSNAFLTRTTAVKDAVWPEIRIYALIKATPMEAAGLYHALDYQKEYVPNLKVSRPVKHVSPTEVHTAYEMKMPWPVGTSKYVHGTKISLEGSAPRIDWYVVESDSAEEVKGYARFLELGLGSTLLVYNSFIRPKSLLAGAVKKAALHDTNNSIKAIVQHIEKLVQAKSPLVPKYKGYFEEALAGKAVYAPIIEGKKP